MYGLDSEKEFRIETQNSTETVVFLEMFCKHITVPIFNILKGHFSLELNCNDVLRSIIEQVSGKSNL